MWNKEALFRELNACKELNKHFYSNRVGYTMGMIKELYLIQAEPTVKSWRLFYYSRVPLKNLTETKGYIMNKFSLPESIAKEYVDKRLVVDTWVGFQQEAKAYKELKKLDKSIRFATNEEDSKYSVDIVGSTSAYQVKPKSYFTANPNPSLLRDRATHKANHKNFTRIFKKNVEFYTYDLTK